MKPFYEIALPHNDIIKGKLTMDIFAADLWSVFVGKAEQKYQEYQNPEVFFERTYMTYGLNNLIKTVENRLRKGEGNSVIQLQTPFGGGKTHSLIALYHKAKEWGAKVVVLDGTVFNPEETTLWGEIERQLTGKISELATKVSPGREKLANLLEKHTPLLILLDELLEYAVRAKGVKIGDTTLSVQVAPFLQELETTVSILDRAVLILTLPSSISERYESDNQILFQQLQKISGRTEKIHTPVKDEEISQVINKRLFERINEKESRKNIDEYIKYFEKENIISDISNYRDRFLRTFPFEPSVIDVLYHRWGSLPTFQRTRGVLRILAIVVNNLLRSDVPFIRLSDFDLSNEELRGELVKHVGSEYESVISADITSSDSASRKADNSLQKFSYLKMGTKISTTIFMYSFTGDQEKGPNLTELKINCSIPDIPSSLVVECLEELKKHSFYISDSGYFFTTKPNLNRIHLNKINNITDREIDDYELELIREIFRDKNSKLGSFKVYIWPSTHKDVPDNKDIKLIVMKESNENQCEEFV
ncbi:MAG: DUF499 domain-containing protein [bacterium]|nr:DUF499 domain-containing protein [bacterium]